MQASLPPGPPSRRPDTTELATTDANKRPVVVVLATGGTIAGLQGDRRDGRYVAGQVGVEALIDAAHAALQARRALSGGRSEPTPRLEAEQVAQIDSKDMTHSIWQTLALRCAAQLARPEVRGVVVTHGTDTLEETASFLSAVLASSKPVVLTGAMLPADSRQADGPANLAAAIELAGLAAPAALVRGTVVALGGQAIQADVARKWHPWQLSAFVAPQAAASSSAKHVAPLPDGVVALERDGRWEPARTPVVNPAPVWDAVLWDAVLKPVAQWPRVAVLYCHAGMDEGYLDAITAQGFDGLVLACMGNGSLPAEVERRLPDWQARGLLGRVTRCPLGQVQDTATAEPAAQRSKVLRSASVAKARVDLLVCLMRSGLASSAAQPDANQP